MTNEQFATQRRWQRLPLCIPMFVRWRDEHGRTTTELATALNISGGGALLAMHNFVPIGTPITIELPHSPVVEPSFLEQSVTKLESKIVRLDHSGRMYLAAATFAQPLAAPLNIATAAQA